MIFFFFYDNNNYDVKLMPYVNYDLLPVSCLCFFAWQFGCLFFFSISALLVTTDIPTAWHSVLKGFEGLNENQYSVLHLCKFMSQCMSNYITEFWKMSHCGSGVVDSHFQSITTTLKGLISFMWQKNIRMICQKPSSIFLEGKDFIYKLYLQLWMDVIWYQFVIPYTEKFKNNQWSFH